MNLTALGQRFSSKPIEHGIPLIPKSFRQRKSITEHIRATIWTYRHQNSAGIKRGHFMTREQFRLKQSRERAEHWKRWGPYVSERAWGTVREDYSPWGEAWEYFPHDHAKSRAYRWNEDSLAHQRLCFAPALWNGQDAILKERLFGLTGNEGNHGEDVKEYYFYLDSTPTHSYMKYLYKISAGRVSLCADSQREPQASKDRARVRAVRHRHIRWRPLF